MIRAIRASLWTDTIYAWPYDEETWEYEHPIEYISDKIPTLHFFMETLTTIDVFSLVESRYSLPIDAMGNKTGTAQMLSIGMSLPNTYRAIERGTPLCLDTLEYEFYPDVEGDTEHNVKSLDLFNYKRYVDHIRERIIASLGIPREYLGY